MYATLAAIRRATRWEFTPALAARHHFVRTPSGNWFRTLGAPGLLPEDVGRFRLRQTAPRVWHIERA